MVEATGIRDVPSGPLLRIGHDRFVPGLRRLVETVRDASGGTTRLFIQIIDFLAIRRRPEPAKFFQRYLALRPEHVEALSELDGVDYSATPEEDVRARLAELDDAAVERVFDSREVESLRHGYRERVTDTHLDTSASCRRCCPGSSPPPASRAEDAGFDGVELHYAHAYTMASFLSALNDRDDGYGGVWTDASACRSRS